MDPHPLSRLDEFLPFFRIIKNQYIAPLASKFQLDSVLAKKWCNHPARCRHPIPLEQTSCCMDRPKTDRTEMITRYYVWTVCMPACIAQLATDKAADGTYKIQATMLLLTFLPFVPTPLLMPMTCEPVQ
jgi:hypothetical protein